MLAKASIHSALSFDFIAAQNGFPLSRE